MAPHCGVADPAEADVEPSAVETLLLLLPLPLLRRRSCYRRLFRDGKVLDQIPIAAAGALVAVASACWLFVVVAGCPKRPKRQIFGVAIGGIASRIICSVVPCQLERRE